MRLAADNRYAKFILFRVLRVVIRPEPLQTRWERGHSRRRFGAERSSSHAAKYMMADDQSESRESKSDREDAIPQDRRKSSESSAPSADILFAAGIGLKEDDPTLPCLTIRMWFLAYPLGKGWEMVVPDWGFNFRGTRHSLNPGPFNYKENILIYILANLSFATRLSADVLTEQRHFYGLKAGWGFELLITLCTSRQGERYWEQMVHVALPLLHDCLLRFLLLVFGMKSGMGLLPITFDRSQIPYIGSPLFVPAWAILNILASLVFWIYIVSPEIYYSNTWYTAHLPFQGNAIFDNTGNKYNVSRVIDKKLDFSFNHTKYEQYSPLYVPMTYALNTFGLCFATLSSLFVWLYLEKREPIMGVAKTSSLGRLWWKSGNGEAAVTLRNPQSRYSAAPTWWYWVLAFVSLGVGVFACEFYPAQLRWHGAIFSLFISLVFFVPLAWVYATTNVKIKTQILCRIIAGYGLAFAQDLKLGIYCNIPPRKLFLVQCVGMVVDGVTQVGVVNWALENIPNICTNKAANGFNCHFSRTHFNASLIWGGVGLLYKGLLYFFLLGALRLPALALAHKGKPASWEQHADQPVNGIARWVVSLGRASPTGNWGVGLTYLLFSDGA
ncbi:hypothetical protein RB594_004213 [Gaeumannomyces avenae]